MDDVVVGAGVVVDGAVVVVVDVVVVDVDVVDVAAVLVATPTSAVLDAQAATVMRRVTAARAAPTVRVRRANTGEA